MLESEQAQAITAPRYRAVHTLSQMTTEPDGEWVHYDAHKAIVDSQAQKIAQLTEERDEQTATAYRLGSEAQQHISEARKIAEKMRDASERPGGGHTLLPWEKQ